jgi:fumarate reductase (CoM/CoB) subunit A
MEFIEFSAIPAPKGIPLSSGGIKPLTGRGAKFYNSFGERFMEKYEPEQKELAKRGTIVYCIFKEINEGRGPVYMDATEISENDFYTMEQIEKKGILLNLKECGVDYKIEKFQWVSPAVHAFLGGLKINPNCETSINGLYAAGENAGGVYGADRVGSYLTACAVFGFRAGMNASKMALTSKQKELPMDLVDGKIQTLESMRKQRDGKQPNEILSKVKEIAGKYISCERNEVGLKDAAERFKQIMENEINEIQTTSTEDFVKILEIRNLCLTGLIVATSALNRKETRGQHRRSDYPNKDDSMLKHILVKKDGDKISVTNHRA